MNLPSRSRRPRRSHGCTARRRVFAYSCHFVAFAMAPIMATETRCWLAVRTFRFRTAAGLRLADGRQGHTLSRPVRLGFYLQMQRLELRGVDFERCIAARLFVLLIIGVDSPLLRLDVGHLHLYAIAASCCCPCAALAIARCSSREFCSQRSGAPRRRRGRIRPEGSWTACPAVTRIPMCCCARNCPSAVIISARWQLL